MNGDTVAILEGNTFVVSDRRGDIEASPATPHGLFVDDTRFLSRWVLTVDGRRPAILSFDDVEYFEAQFFLAPGSGTVYINHLEGGCSHLGQGNYALVTRQSGSGLCHGDIAEVADVSNGITVGSCVIGDFVPYTRVG